MKIAKNHRQYSGVPGFRASLLIMNRNVLGRRQSFSCLDWQCVLSGCWFTCSRPTHSLLHCLNSIAVSLRASFRKKYVLFNHSQQQSLVHVESNSLFPTLIPSLLGISVPYLKMTIPIPPPLSSHPTSRPQVDQFLQFYVI